MAIDCIMVTYSSNEIELFQSLNSIASQVRTVYVVDNSSGQNAALVAVLARINRTNIIPILLGENTGIGHALNVGISKSLECGPQFVMISDEDTIYPAGYVEAMEKAYFKNDPSLGPIAALGPSYFEQIRGGKNAGFIVKQGFITKKIFPDQGCFRVSALISSGLIVPSEVFCRVGLMREDFFMDYIDVEWCWRAQSKGFNVVGCADVSVKHSLGNRVVKVLSRKVAILSPSRQYYQTRNMVYLALFYKEIALSARMYLIKMIFMALFFSIFLGGSPVQYARANARGIIDGFRRILGKNEEVQR